MNHATFRHDHEYANYEFYVLMIASANRSWYLRSRVVLVGSQSLRNLRSVLRVVSAWFLLPQTWYSIRTCHMHNRLLAPTYILNFPKLFTSVPINIAGLGPSLMALYTCE